MTYTVSIEPVKGRKGRTFQAYLLNYVTADGAWERGSGELERPVYLAFTTTEREAHAFTANLRAGRRAVVRNEYGHEREKIEFLKKAGHRYVTRRCPRSGSAIVTVYLPELFELDPGLLDPRIRFVFAPATWWVERELSSPALETFDPEERRELVVAAYFAAYLDRRTPLPILNDPRFHRQLYRAAREQAWWNQETRDFYSSSLEVEPEELVGLELVSLIDVDPESFEEFLCAQTSIYYETIEASRPDRSSEPPSPVPPLQLSLFDLPGFAPSPVAA